MFEPDSAAPTGVDSLAHLIQIALTPVFLLTGIAALLGVFANRLARVSDRSHAVASGMEIATDAARARLQAEAKYLHRRTRMLDAAVLLGTFGGGSTCGAAFLLFVGSLRNATIAGLVYLCFGLALLTTSGALLAFMVEVLLASRGLRETQDVADRQALKRETVRRPVSR